MSSPLDGLEIETATSPEWAVVWLHGLGADGHDFAPIVPELVQAGWPALRFVFPHAPVRPITINNGVRMRGWYDIASFDFADRADRQGVLESVAQVETLIEREQARGIPPERLLLAGFSQGGAITLAAGLRRQVPLAGLIGLSTYLPDLAHAGEHLVAGAQRQPLFMAHGQSDPVIPMAHARHSAQALEQLGFAVEWHQYAMARQVCAEEIADLAAWMGRRFLA